MTTNKWPWINRGSKLALEVKEDQAAPRRTTWKDVRIRGAPRDQRLAKRFPSERVALEQEENFALEAHQGEGQE